MDHDRSPDPDPGIPDPPRLAAVVLAGGTAVRMDGIDKAGVEYRGRTLLAHVLDALVDADEVVVVGEQVTTDRPVTFVREDPPFGGPVAGLLTGVAALLRRPAQVAVTAVDMPRVSSDTFRRLRAALTPRPGAAPRDAAFLREAHTDRRQLCGVIDAARLAAVAPGLEQQHGMAMHRLLDPLRVVDVPALGAEAADVDTWQDLRDLPE